MKKFSFCLSLFVLFVFTTSRVIGQCPEEPVVLVSQAQVDEFASTYPDCIELVSLIIDSEIEDPILNLDSLSNLVYIDVLYIHKIGSYDESTDTTIPASIEGLANLDSLEIFEISPISLDNFGVRKIESLMPLANIGGSMERIEIFSSDLFDDLPDFNNLNELEDFNLILATGLSNVPNFENLEALENFNLRLTDLNSLNMPEDLVVSSFSVVTNGNLSSINFPSGCNDWALSISHNGNLTSITSGVSVDSLSSLNLSFNPSLVNYEVFDNLEKINGDLILESCTPDLFNSLHNLKLAQSIKLGFGVDAVIDTIPGGWVPVEPFSCEQPVEVLNVRIGENVDELIVQGGESSDFSLSTRDAEDVNFTANLKSARSLTLNLGQATSVTGFEELDSLYTSDLALWIYHPQNQAIPNFTNLKNLNGNILVEMDDEPSGLLNLSGLDSLRSVKNIKIDAPIADHAFESLNGLESLQRIHGQLKLAGLPNLSDISALANVNYINKLYLDSLSALDADFTFSQLDLLHEMHIAYTGLAQLPYFPIEELNSLYLDHNINLQNTIGIESLNHISGDMTITNNNVLAAFIMTEDATVDGQFTFKFNDSMVDCAQSVPFCSLISSAESFDIEMNGENCNDGASILESCLLQTGSSAKEEFAIYPNPASSNVFLAGFSNPVVRIYALDGSLVFSSRGRFQIDVSTLHSGLYLVEVNENENFYRAKLVVD